MPRPSDPKPAGLDRRYAEQFCDASVADAYQHRPPYPRELFDILVRLIPPGERPANVLDVGCGRGEVARPLVARPEVARVDAVDLSAAMIERGRALSNGDHPRLRWICADVESATLDPPYALITAGSSLHWMDWAVVLPKLGAALTSGGVFAIFDDDALPEPWDADVGRLIARYSTNRDFTPYNLVDELVRRGLFVITGRTSAAAVEFRQTLADYIESIHSRNGFSRQRMTQRDAAEFDEEVRRVVGPHAFDGTLLLRPVTTVVWGRSVPAE